MGSQIEISVLSRFREFPEWVEAFTIGYGDYYGGYYGRYHLDSFLHSLRSIRQQVTQKGDGGC